MTDTPAHPDRAFVAALLAVGALLLLARLGDAALWQDEAETALLARSIATHGVPWAEDAGLIVSSAPGRHLEFEAPDYTWRWSPWLQFYAVAGSFAVLGESAFAARLPSVLFALGTLWLVYQLAFLLSGDRAAARVAAALLLVSVPFLLYARQARYYAPLCFFAVLLFHEYERALRGGRGAGAGLIVAGSGLVQAHYPAAGCLFASVALHFAWRARGAGAGRALVTGAAGTTLLGAPWILYFAPGALAAGPLEFSDDPLARFVLALAELNRFALPFAVAALPLLPSLRPQRNADGEAPSAALAIALAFPISLIVLASAMPFYFFRYYVMLVPLGAVLQALIWRRLWQRQRALGAALLALLLFTDLPSRLVPGATPARSSRNMQTGDESPAELVGAWARFTPLAAYLYEITHPYQGPIEAIAAYLNEHAEPGDVVLTWYGDLPLRFHTGLVVIGGAGGEPLEQFDEPRWVVPRHYTPPRPDVRAYVEGRAQQLRYRSIQLDAHELPWENRPAPTYHKFRSPSSGPKVLLWERFEPTE